jgi:hypothetical protein
VGGVAILYREAVTGLSPGRLCRLRRARLAFEDVQTVVCGRDAGLAKSGWRLGGTLGTGNKKRLALKERKNRSRTQSHKSRVGFDDDDKLRRRTFSPAPSERSALNIQYPGFRKASTLG